MKKNFLILFSIFLVIFLHCNSANVKAKTLGDLKKELDKTKEDYNKTKEDKKLTENQMSNINSNISNIQVEIKKTSSNIEQLSKDIEQLNSEIELKEKEIKKIINFYQVSNGNAAYLEYIFGANNFTDMIYRTAVIEQLSSYNKKLINEFNTKINENKNKQSELEQKQKDLSAKQKSLEKEYSSLGSKLQEIVDIKVDEEEAIKVQEEIIKMYQNKGCKENDNILICGKKVLPYDTKFWRPLNSGYISSNYGYRSSPLGGKSELHTGIDIGAAGGTPVYATANGTVAALTIKYNCGGNMVYIHHNVNGKYYTSLYMHLRTIAVSKGDTVTKNTIIGYVGGDKSTPWDRCSTGAHNHFTLLNGLVGTDYRAWSSTFYAKLVNPRNYVNFPALGKRFNDRLTAY